MHLQAIINFTIDFAQLLDQKKYQFKRQFEGIYFDQ